MLYCATTNPGKLREFHLTLDGSAFSLQVVPDLANITQPEETGSTFEQNAILKAVYYSKQSPGLLFADDSGLEVDALDSQPGVYSARFAGAGASDEANNRLVVERMRAKSDRTARFVCVIALARSGKLIRTFPGVVAGQLLESPAGGNGFGYDPLFFYPPFGCSFGEAPLERKLQVSHRSQALHAMLAYLQSGSSSGSSRSSSLRR